VSSATPKPDRVAHERARHVRSVAEIGRPLSDHIAIGDRREPHGAAHAFAAHHLDVEISFEPARDLHSGVESVRFARLRIAASLKAVVAAVFRAERLQPLVNEIHLRPKQHRMPARRAGIGSCDLRTRRAGHENGKPERNSSPRQSPFALRQTAPHQSPVAAVTARHGTV
jgi:hypothetical protein